MIKLVHRNHKVIVLGYLGKNHKNLTVLACYNNKVYFLTYEHFIKFVYFFRNIVNGRPYLATITICALQLTKRRQTFILLPQFN